MGINIKIHIDNESFNSKPTKRDSKRISKEITNTVSEVTVKEFSELIGSKGHTSMFGLMNKRSKDNVYFQEVLALDFDNQDEDKKQTTGNDYVTIEDVKENNFIQDYASFIYKTFSHTDNWERFRVVFILDEPLYINDTIEQAYTWLMNKFPLADKANKDSSRLFYGGIQGVTEINFDNRLLVSMLGIKDKDLGIGKIKNKDKQTTEVENVVSKVSPTYQLIKAGEKEIVRSRWLKYGKGKTFDTNPDTFEFFRQLPMSEMLGVGGNPFRDILIYEENPSASIWKPKDANSYLYTTLNKQGANGNNKTYDIIQVIMELLNTNYSGAKDYLIYTTGVKIGGSKELKEIKEQITDFQNKIMSDTFEEQHPEMYKMFSSRSYASDINAVLDVFKSQLYDYEGEVRSLTWISEKNLAKRLGMEKPRLQKVLNKLTLTKVVDKLDAEVIPESLLELLITNKENFRSDDGEWVERNKEREYRSNVYELNLVMDNLDETEYICIVLINKHFTLTGLSREYLLRTFGKEAADRVYPQDKDKVVSKKSEEIVTEIHKIVRDHINTKGYAIIKEVKEVAMGRLDKSLRQIDYKYKQSEAEMIDKYDLKKISLTNDLRGELEITHLKPNARPKILMK